MPATAERSAFVREPYRIVKNGPLTTVESLWGKLARRTTSPIPTYFESEGDAQALCDARMSLLGAGRRRMVQAVLGEQTGLGIDYTGGTVTAQVIDADREIDAPMAVTNIEIDFGSQTTTIESWG